MSKNNDLLVSNTFKNKKNQEKKQIFTQRMAELINQMGNPTLSSICKQGDRMYNKNQANRLVLIESPSKRGDKT